MVPVTAVATGVVLSSIGLFTAPSGIVAWFSRLIEFFRDLIGLESTEILGDKIKASRVSTFTGIESTFLGFTSAEIGVVVLGAFSLGLAFYFADRYPINWTILVIFILVGGVTTTLHEVAHWAIAHRYQSDTEFNFWGVGTLIMFVTAWLFGNVFAQPSLTIMHAEEELDSRQRGHIMLAGPLVSILIAVGCGLIAPMGGIIATAATIGLSMNLLASVYSLIPIKPLDGNSIFNWNRLIWGALFIPLIIVFIFIGGV